MVLALESIFYPVSVQLGVEQVEALGQQVLFRHRTCCATPDL